VRIGDLLTLLFLAAAWGASFLFMRVASPEFGPIGLVTFRTGLAGLALSYVFLQSDARAEAKAHWWQLTVSGFVGTAIPFALFAYATLKLSAGFTSLLNASIPIFSALIATVWLRDRLTGKQLLGLAFGLLGVSILVWNKLDFDPSGQGWAIFACLMATLCYGFVANWMKSKLPAVRPLVGSAGSLLGATVVLIPLAFIFPPSRTPSLEAWLHATALALVSTALAFVFFFRLIRESSATVATSVAFLIPFFGIFWGCLFLDEKVTSQMLVGLAVTLSGTALITGLLGRKPN